MQSSVPTLGASLVNIVDSSVPHTHGFPANAEQGQLSPCVYPERQDRAYRKEAGQSRNAPEAGQKRSCKEWHGGRLLLERGRLLYTPQEHVNGVQILWTQSLMA